MVKRKILLAEDETNLANLIKLNLEIEGYTIIHTENGKKAIDLFKSELPHLAILDIMLPELSGIEICKQIKKIRSETPVLFLSAKSSGTDRIDGLKSGADDYLTKPFNLEELLLRVQILLKRYPTQEIDDSVLVNGIHVNFTSFEIILKNNKKVKLPNRELQLLKLLISRKNQVISRDEIIKQLWAPDENPSSRTIDNFILSFRKIFEDDPKNPKYFQSIRSIGYKFTPEHEAN